MRAVTRPACVLAMPHFELSIGAYPTNPRHSFYETRGVAPLTMRVCGRTFGAKSLSPAVALYYQRANLSCERAFLNKLK